MTKCGDNIRACGLLLSTVFAIGAGLSPAWAEEVIGPMTPAPSGDIDTVTWALPYSEPETLDWVYAWDYAAQNTILANLCEGLRRTNLDGSIGFALATEVRKPNELTFVYTLRSDVTFTNGKPMTAEDVSFSLKRHMTAQPDSYWGPWYANVADISATGPHEVTVKFSKLDVLFDQMMASPAGYVGEKAFIEAAGGSYGTAGGGVMCTGPYQIGAWNAGHDITLTRNEQYWDQSLQPKAQSISFVSIIDPSSLAAALITGEADAAWAPATTILPSLRSADSGDLYMNSGTELVVMMPTNLKGALADPRVRQALRKVIDYQGIVQGILGGAGESTAVLTPALVWGDFQKERQEAMSSAPPAVQDLEGAKALVAEIGAPIPPIRIAVSADDVQIASTLAAVQHSAAEAGLTVEFQRVPAQEIMNFLYDPAARERFDLYTGMVTSEIPDPLELYSQIAPGAPYNFANINDPAFVDPLNAALAESDAQKRAALTAQAEKGLTEGAYYFPLYAPYSRVFLGKRITGAPVSTLSQLYYPWAALIGKR